MIILDREPTVQELYNQYIELGKKLFAAVKPTEEELTDMADEVAEERLTDWVVDTSLNSGDFGFTAVYIFESREIAEEEKAL